MNRCPHGILGGCHACRETVESIKRTVEHTRKGVERRMRDLRTEGSAAMDDDSFGRIEGRYVELAEIRDDLAVIG